MTPSPSDLAILRHLAGRTFAAAPEVGAACRLSPNELRPRLAALESHRLVGSRQDATCRPPVRVFYATAEGRRAAGVTTFGQDLIASAKEARAMARGET